MTLYWVIWITYHGVDWLFPGINSTCTLIVIDSFLRLACASRFLHVLGLHHVVLWFIDVTDFFVFAQVVWRVSTLSFSWLTTSWVLTTINRWLDRRLLFMIDYTRHIQLSTSMILILCLCKLIIVLLGLQYSLMTLLPINVVLCSISTFDVWQETVIMVLGVGDQKLLFSEIVVQAALAIWISLILIIECVRLFVLSFVLRTWISLAHLGQLLMWPCLVERLTIHIVWRSFIQYFVSSLHKLLLLNEGLLTLRLLSMCQHLITLWILGVDQIDLWLLHIVLVLHTHGTVWLVSALKMVHLLLRVTISMFLWWVM